MPCLQLPLLTKSQDPSSLRGLPGSLCHLLPQNSTSHTLQTASLQQCDFIYILPFAEDKVVPGIHVMFHSTSIPKKPHSFILNLCIFHTWSLVWTQQELLGADCLVRKCTSNHYFQECWADGGRLIPGKSEKVLPSSMMFTWDSA